MTDPGHVHDPACAVAHGEAPQPADGRTVVAVFDSPVARMLLHFARETGYDTVLVDPALADLTPADPGGTPARVAAGFEDVGPEADVVVCDHHRPELGEVLRDGLAARPRWIGLMGNPKHMGPHVELLRALDVPEEEIATVRRPIGLNIGSRTPAEIAVATLAGLIADRNGRPGGFDF